MSAFYSSPSGNFPQRLPDYWKFEDGTINTNLQSLSNQELLELGWYGPYEIPTPMTIITDEELNEVNPNTGLKRDDNLKDFTYDQENKQWISKNYDYDQRTHKVVWYSAERRFIIIPIEEDDTQYKILVNSSDLNI